MTAAEGTLFGLKPIARGRGGVALMLLLGVWFFLVFPTEPLYFENQNTKFLHGMALAGIGHLDSDWTAGTIDVMPVFTGVVYLLHITGSPAVVYLVQIVLFAVFLYAVVQIAVFAAGRHADGLEHFRVRSVQPAPPPDHPQGTLALGGREGERAGAAHNCSGNALALPIIIGALVVASQFSNGGARVWGGVAKQYLLGPALEPQSFGVLFLLAMVWFLKGRTESALWLTALPALIHPGYVVPAGTLILGFLVSAWFSPDVERRPRLAVIIGSLVATGASMVYLGLMILPTSAESFQAANEILAKVRIPRHAVPAYWFDFDAGAKVAGLLLALWLAWRRSRDLFWVIAVCLGIGATLTALAALIDSNELGMVSPWRISVYLVPIGLAILLGQLVIAALKQTKRSAVSWPLKTLGAALALLVLAVTVKGAAEKMKLYRSAAAVPHVVYMRETGDADTLYLTSPFAMNIRLESGLPQLVSWKTHPYKDVEVLEWYRRYLLAERVFNETTIDCDALTEAIDAYGTTHLLIDDEATSIACANALPIFEGEQARIYRLSP